ncbi:MAG: hypothetical protein HYW15_02680 [Candidatus Giovannonibacteria bacterium]|nr:MAG: hypothetical protein HYW15_02680 [Candidatus Giovannonibacteria bacterium]
MRVFNLIVKILESKNLVLYFSIISITLLVFGFVIWNVYLYTLGFIEDEIIKARFIITGFFFFFLTIILFSILKVLGKLLSYFFINIYCHANDFGLFFKKIGERMFKSLWLEFVFLFLIIWIIIYSVYIFPSIPLVIGGGQPRSLSFLVSDKGLGLLKSLEIKMGANAPNQTENICIAYEGSNKVIILREGRVLAINRDLIEGFGSLPGFKDVVLEPNCVAYARAWSRQGLSSQLKVFVTAIFNKTTNTLGIPIRVLLIEQN